MVPTACAQGRHISRFLYNDFRPENFYAHLHRKIALSSLPSLSPYLFLPQTATALGKLGHPDGELNLTRAAAKHDIIQMVRLKKKMGVTSRSVPINK